MELHFAGQGWLSLCGKGEGLDRNGRTPARNGKADVAGSQKWGKRLRAQRPVTVVAPS